MDGWEGEGGYSDGCRPRLGRAQCQGLSGTLSFLGACSAPSWGPSRVQGYMVSARQVHLPHYLCPTHASTLLSPAPSAPYGNDLLLPDLADTHGSPSAYATVASVSSVLGFMNGWGEFKSSVSLPTCTSTICYGKKTLIKMVKWGESQIHPVHISLSYNINIANCLPRRAKRQFFSH